MNLRSLRIDKMTFGENKGKVIATIAMDDGGDEMKLQLSEAASLRILEVASSEMVTAATHAAAEFGKRIEAALRSNPV